MDIRASMLKSGDVLEGNRTVCSVAYMNGALVGGEGLKTTAALEVVLDDGEILVLHPAQTVTASRA